MKKENEFRIVEKKSLTKKGVITYYIPQFRIITPDQNKKSRWLNAREYSDGSFWSSLFEARYPSIEEAKEQIKKCKKSLEYYQYEKVVHTE